MYQAGRNLHLEVLLLLKHRIFADPICKDLQLIPSNYYGLKTYLKQVGQT